MGSRSKIHYRTEHKDVTDCGWPVDSRKTVQDNWIDVNCKLCLRARFNGLNNAKGPRNAPKAS